MSVVCMSDSDMSVVCTSDYRHVFRYSLLLCTFCGYIFWVNKTACFCEFFCDPSHSLHDVFFCLQTWLGQHCAWETWECKDYVCCLRVGSIGAYRWVRISLKIVFKNHLQPLPIYWQSLHALCYVTQVLGKSWSMFLWHWRYGYLSSFKRSSFSRVQVAISLSHEVYLMWVLIPELDSFVLANFLGDLTKQGIVQNLTAMNLHEGFNCY